MKGFKIFLKIFLTVICALILVVGVFIIYSAITTYHPSDKENIEIKGNTTSKINKNNELKVLSWNVGYFGLDEEEDFFMDGGKMVRAQSKEKVVENGNAITKKINELNPDFVLLQEVDAQAKRSYYVDELNLIDELVAKDKYDRTYAINYRSGYVPYPFPTTIGRVEAGLVSLSKYKVEEASRIQLPIPFSWPISMFNLKRCLLVNRVKIEGSDKELVMVNLHLEAYDSGEGKIAQTKMLKEFIDKEYEKGNYVIAGGDFNQTFSNVKNKYYKDDAIWKPGDIDINDFKGYSLLMDDKNPTCRSLQRILKGENKQTFPYYVIDGFIVSSNVKVNNLETLNYEFKNTDHNPVLLKVELV